MQEAKIDYLDLAPWDVAKRIETGELAGRTLLSLFTELPRGNVRLGASGKIMSARQAGGVLDAGCDTVMIGRGAILHHDFPARVFDDHAYQSPALPVTETYLRDQGLSASFIGYMRNWDGFVVDDTALRTALT
jgi:2,4-dienoyl-CoA reductase-like NADH-dependent reductase (Old Yellow Enzyme family)